MLNVYAPNNIASKDIKQKLLELQETDKSTIIVGAVRYSYFNN